MTSLQRTVEAQVAGGLVPGAVALVADGDDITAVAAGVRAVGGAPGWATVPAFPAGAGGLVSTADDWCTFGRMLLAGGEHRGERILSADAVRQMMTSHVEAEPDNPFLEGHGWGFGGSVDLASTEPWNVPGRYGWIGGIGTAAYVIPSRRRVVIWMGQVELEGSDDAQAMAAVPTWAAQHPAIVAS